MQRVVVTGMGTVNALGLDVNETVTAMHQQQVGIAPITKFDASETGITVAGEVKHFEVEHRMPKRLAKRMDLFTQYALYTAIEAYEQAELSDEAVDPDRLAVIYGSGIGGLTTIETQVTRMVQKGPKRVSPMFVPMSIINMAPGAIAQQFNAHGTSYAVVTACASATNAIGEAYRHIQHGDADVVITGGAEASVNEIGIAGFAALTALSPATDAQQASLPFGRDRSGFVMGEGAGTLILESLEHAEARGAKILGEIVGYGSTSDAYHMTSPDPEGTQASRAMQQAIADAGLTVDQISYVNAHGTATTANDAMEALAIRRVFGDHPVLVSSTKALTGHLLGAAGAVETIMTLAALRDGRLPVNVGGVADDTLAVDLVTSNNQQQTSPYALSNSFGFGGHNAVLALKRW